MKVCIEPDCWWPATAGTRCAEHNRQWRRVHKDPKYATKTHRGVIRDTRCACCGTTGDLCRDHLPDGTYQTLCRSCNGSKSGRVTEDQHCPQHGGVIVDRGNGANGNDDRDY